MKVKTYSDRKADERTIYSPPPTPQTHLVLLYHNFTDRLPHAGLWHKGNIHSTFRQVSRSDSRLIFSSSSVIIIHRHSVRIPISQFLVDDHTTEDLPPL